jgi:hypothetical protein
MRAGAGSDGVVRWCSGGRGTSQRLAFELGTMRTALDASHFSATAADLPSVELARGQLVLFWR